MKNMHRLGFTFGIYFVETIRRIEIGVVAGDISLIAFLHLDYLFINVIFSKFSNGLLLCLEIGFKSLFVRIFIQAGLVKGIFGGLMIVLDLNISDGPDLGGIVVGESSVVFWRDLSDCIAFIMEIVEFGDLFVNKSRLFLQFSDFTFILIDAFIC